MRLPPLAGRVDKKFCADATTTAGTLAGTGGYGSRRGESIAPLALDWRGG